MLNSEKIRAIAIAIIELRLPEGISHSVSRSVENFVKKDFLKIFLLTLWKDFWLI